jgi:hypothetical protein
MMQFTIIAFAFMAAPAVHAQDYRCVIDGQEVRLADPCPGPGTVGEELLRRRLKRQAVSERAEGCEKLFAGRLPVENSPWDGSVGTVERYLKRSLKDPDSFKAVEWTPVRKGCGNYTVGLSYRAKNSFGGYVVEQAVFTLDADGNVTGMLRVK